MPMHNLASSYGQQLVDVVVPFWTEHALDREMGGYFTFLDRKGQVYGTDKYVWLQARQVWMFSKLYNAFESRPEWLEVARQGYAFLEAHAFDADGRVFFALTRDGRPLRKRRYLFSETFAAIACSEYARASGDEAALERARATFRLLWRLYRTAGALEPKIDPRTRRCKALAMPMVLLATTHEMRLADGDDPLYRQVVEHSLDEIRGQFLRRDECVLFETVGAGGERLDTPEGRCINPGHEIEASWFLMREGVRRDDQDILRDALDILDWSLARGWDVAYGGLYSFLDVQGRPPLQLEWDMKLWWPQGEAMIASLAAYALTGEQRYVDWHERIGEYVAEHFIDREFGEWYGYLHRDGTVALDCKGSAFKGAFHVPRTFWMCYLIALEGRAAQPWHLA